MKGASRYGKNILVEVKLETLWFKLFLESIFKGIQQNEGILSDQSSAGNWMSYRGCIRVLIFIRVLQPLDLFPDWYVSRRLLLLSLGINEPISLIKPDLYESDNFFRAGSILTEDDYHG